MTLTNFHSHTIYDDGTSTPEEMLQAAIAKGFAAFGFSGHSYAPFDMPYCMSVDGTREYIAEVTRLKEKYADEIEVYLGIEQEYYSAPHSLGTDGSEAGLCHDCRALYPAEKYDFTIGAVHYIKKGGELFSIDFGAEMQKRAAETHFGGDFYAMTETYFETVADVMRKTGADIVGHFDLIAKYNTDGRLFDEANPRYTGAAINAMEHILKTHRLFEVNTGAMYRIGRPEPYPSEFLLKELQKRGGEVILSSDCHDVESICWKFDEMRELLKSCGFRYVKRLAKNGFIDEKI